MNTNDISEEKPHPCCKNGVKRCELVSLTASQASSFFIFLIFIILDIISISNGRYSIGTAKEKHGIIEQIFTVLVLVNAIITLFYYYLGTWVAEEDFIDQLRDIDKFWFYLQWLIRIVIIACFGLYTNLEFDFIPKEFHVTWKYEFINLYTLGIFLLSFLWDLAVILGGGWEIVKPFILWDLLGCICLASLQFFLKTQNFVLSAVMVLLFGYLSYHMFVALKGYKGFRVFSRLLNHNKLR